MPPDELDPTPEPQDNDTQPMQEGLHISQLNQMPIDPAVAVAAFMEWLQSREERTGPFSVHYAVEAGNALVDAFCAAQGWIAVVLDEQQVEQVKALREKYPD